MAKITAQVARGTRDFLPQQVRKRQYIMDTLRRVFERYGFAPIETPAIETLDVLEGKYGDEGDQLLFRILNSGPFMEKVPPEALQDGSTEAMRPHLTEKALRYDLTVPLARYVVNHQHELSFPFKRYQMQPVWRADKPQKGRYREFMQCDADVVGSDSLLHDAELLALYVKGFAALGLVELDIAVNNRKVLTGLAEVLGVPERLVDLTVAIDKLDKIGLEGVRAELERKGMGGIWGKLKKWVNNTTEVGAMAAVNNMLVYAKSFLATSRIGLQGIAELDQVLSLADCLIANRDLVVKPVLSLARGLSYYTGTIVEVKVSHPDVQMGSIGGGGRYDNLTELFGGRDLPGVGISFGLDRIYDVLEELNRWPAHLQAERSSVTEVLIVNFGGEDEAEALGLLAQLRVEGIPSELYYKPAKLGKQFGYADKLGIPWVVVQGAEERAAGQVQLKNMDNGEQEALTLQAVISRLRPKG